MNTYIIMASLAWYFSMSLQGAVVQKGQSQFQDRESKINMQSWRSGDKEFWKYADIYNRVAGGQEEERREPLSIMWKLLEQNFYLCSKYQKSLPVMSNGNMKKLAICYPLYFAAAIAHGKEDASPEWDFFKAVLRLDKNEERLTSVMKYSINAYSYDRVFEIMKVLNVTRTPAIMKHIVERCQLLVWQNQDFARRVPLEKLTKEFSKRKTEQRHALVEIADLLLDHNADVSAAVGLIIDPRHLFSCRMCKFIVERAKLQGIKLPPQRIEQAPLPQMSPYGMGSDQGIRPLYIQPKFSYVCTVPSDEFSCKTCENRNWPIASRYSLLSSLLPSSSNSVPFAYYPWNSR